MPSYLQLFFKMTIFRNSIQNGMTKIPTNEILEILYKLRIRVSEKLKTVLALYNMQIHQKKAEPDYHTTRHLWLIARDANMCPVDFNKSF